MTTATLNETRAPTEAENQFNWPLCYEAENLLLERIDAFRALLQNALTVNATLVGQRQNDEIQRLTQTSLDQNDDVKRISAWAAILFAPTLVGTIYGMNFKHMPELGWQLGYPVALLAMAALGIVLYVVFKRRRWL